jgi:hypothetical protein
MRLHGYKGEVSLDPAGAPGTAAAPIGSLTQWSLDMARDMVDVSAFQDTNKQYVPGLMDTKGQLQGWWSSDESGPLFDVAEGDVPAWLKLVPSTLEPTFYWAGLAYLSMSINVQVSGAITIAGTFSGADNWTRNPIALGGLTRGARGETAARRN